MTLTENEYNLIVYCLEQQMYEFNSDEQNDANNIVIKLSNIVEEDGYNPELDAASYT